MLYIIANPLACGEKGKETAVLIEKELNRKNIPHILEYTQYRGHALELARKAAHSEARAIVALGGDGTFFEVLNGITGSQKPLGLISAGRGNDFIRSAVIPSDPIKALDVILAGRTRLIDCLSINGKRCLNITGTGLDVDILMRADKYRSRLKGSFSYYLALIVSLAVFPFRKFTFSADGGETRTENAMMVSLANGRMCGGGLKVAPQALLDDQYIDFVVIKKFPRIKLPFLLAKFLKGKVLELDCVELHRCKSVRLSVEPALPLNVDGELLDALPLEAQIIPQAITIFTP